MPVLHRDDMDIVKELRLRRWAREHHVPEEERRASWHPVVLDEMGLKDDEMLIRHRSRGPVSSFVPLVPTSIQRVHRRHVEQPSKTAVPAEREIAELPSGLQRSDRRHDSVVSHVSAGVNAGNAIGTLQMTTLGSE